MDYFPPNLNSNIPDITNNNELAATRLILSYLNSNGLQKSSSDEVLSQIAQIRDDNGDLIFTDFRDTSPVVVLAQQNAHIGSLNNYYASNVPMLIEDYLIALSGEAPNDARPEFLWVLYTLTNPLSNDFTILRGRRISNEKGLLYVSLYNLTIPANQWGNEQDVDGNYMYMQLFRAQSVGSGYRLTADSKLKTDSSIPYVAKVENPFPSFGGRDPEQFNDYRLRVFQQPVDKLIVAPVDYITEIINYFGPRTRSVVLGPEDLSERNSINKIRISAVKPDGTIVTQLAGGAGLAAYLQEKDPNMDVVIVEPKRTIIQLSMRVSLESYTLQSEETIKDDIKAVLDLYSSPLYWPDWGEKDNTFTKDKVETWIKNYLPEIDYIVVTIEKVSKPGQTTLNAPIDPNVIQLENITGLPIIEILEPIVIGREEYV